VPSSLILRLGCGVLGPDWLVYNLMVDNGAENLD
jgi:hypothetical protein